MLAKYRLLKKFAVILTAMLIAAGVLYGAWFWHQKNVDNKPGQDGQNTYAGHHDSIGLPPTGSLYHGTYPGGQSNEEDDVTPEVYASYTQAAGKDAAWVYFSNNWHKSRSFPIETANWIRNQGSIPYVRLMLRSTTEERVEETLFTLDRINKGDFDSDLKAWMRSARDFGSPIIAEYGTEVNCDCFPWNAAFNGHDNGPARFRDAYRHIIGLSRQEGASNILWVFHANYSDVPDESWNHLESYYPGDDWIDWIGVSVYGPQTPMDEENRSFSELMDLVYPRLAGLSPDKPIALLEFGATSGHSQVDQTAWAEGALKDLTSGKWPRLVGLSWWNEAWENDDIPAHNTDMRLQDSSSLTDVFQRYVGNNDRVLGRVSS